MVSGDGEGDAAGLAAGSGAGISNEACTPMLRRVRCE
jgi:hypothetical protein